MAFTTSPEYKKWWKKKYHHRIGEFYDDYFCHCSERCLIKIQYNHCNIGIPKFIKGHHAKNGNSPWNRPEVRKKISEAKKGQRHPQLDLTKEILKYQHGVIIEGPNYFKTFNDLCEEGSRQYKMKRGVIRRSILKILEIKNLEQLDIVILLNWMMGHPFTELAERYYLTEEEIINSLKKIEKTFPGITMSGQTISDSNQMWSMEILYHMEAEIKHWF